jgi:DinB superfamily
MSFFETVRVIAAIPDSACGMRWEWPGHSGTELDVRNALYLSLLDEQVATASMPSPKTEAAATVVMAQRAFGDLRGLLAGVPDDALDTVPLEGEWSLREILTHLLEVERSYLKQTVYASKRADGDPVVTDRPPPPSEDEIAGGVADWVAKLGEAREGSLALMAFDANVLTRPTQWVKHDVDVRFRLHRFAAHLGEHSIQCEKTLAWLRLEPGEAGRIARLISRERGGHELLSEAATLERLDKAHAERLASIAAVARPA